MASNRVTAMRRAAASAAAGTPVLGKPCASAMSTPGTLAITERNGAPDGVRALPVVDVGGERSADAETTPAAGCEAQRGNHSQQRDDRASTSFSETSPVADITDDRPGDNSTGQVASGTDSRVEPNWPEEAELFALVRPMLTGGDGTPAAPPTHFEPSKATHALLVRVQSAVAKLKKEHGGEMHVVPGTNGRIDQQEGRGYLLGAVLGRGLLSREQAQAAGLDARNKLNALEKRLADQKEAARKAARKLSGEALEKHEAAARDERQAIERERVELNLPPPPKPPPPPPKPCTAAGRKRAEPPPPDPFEDRFEKWCRRQGGTASNFEDLRRSKGLAAWRRAEYAREWNPRTFKGRMELAKLRERDRARNDRCTCDEGVPSFLCRVTACYSFEVVGDGGCTERALPGCHSCLCMLPAWGDDERAVPEASPAPPRAYWGSDPTNPAAGARWDPVPEPAGGWPPIEPEWTHAKWKAAYFAGDIDRREQAMADAREDAAILARRRSTASRSPPSPPGVPMHVLCRLYRERPDAIAQIKGIIGRQDISEAQKMAEVQRVVGQARDAVHA